jgi:hypothetical protein
MKDERGMAEGEQQGTGGRGRCFGRTVFAYGPSRQASARWFGGGKRRKIAAKRRKMKGNR